MTVALLNQIAVDPLALVAVGMAVAVILQWEGAWIFRTRFGRWLLALVGGLSFFFLPRGDFWWGIW